MSKSVTSMGLGDSPDLRKILVDHEYHGLRLQLAVRGLLVVFVALTLFFVPPFKYATICDAILVWYAIWAAGVAVWMRRGGRARVDFSWVPLFVDLAVVAVLTLVTGTAGQSWTANILANALFMIPLLACTQLRPAVCAAVVIPTVAVFLVSSSLTMASNSEPWESVLLSTMALAGLGGGAIALSWIQRSRIHTIGALAQDRTDLLADLMNLEERERQALSEQLHDGALQYVLAARQDVAEVRSGHQDALDRIDQALSKSSKLLRSTAAELHPAVLERIGLVPALRDLAKSASARGGFAYEVNTDHWPDHLRTTVDFMLFSAARELLTNTVKHAHAKFVFVVLQWTGECAVLGISDDGVGIAEEIRARSLSEGHIGLASQELRIAAAGGALLIQRGPEAGTTARIELPATLVACSNTGRSINGTSLKSSPPVLQAGNRAT